MKGDPKIIEALNQALAEELTAINQYMVHAEMYDNWGYEKLNKPFEKIAIDEMKHAEKLIARILFLEGMPIVSKLDKMHIGARTETMIGNDLKNELGTVKLYNEIALLSAKLGDNGTRDLVTAILKDEEGHIDYEEAQIDQIGHIGIENYLSHQIV